MSPVSYQTIRLSRGRHASPEQGACVMELASMLAGETFSDHPTSVCPVIGSFLRAYNDFIGDERRQDLYGYAAKVVGTRSSREVEQVRTERIIAWMTEMARTRDRWYRPAGLSRFMCWLRGSHLMSIEIRAAHSIRRQTAETHRNALALVDELVVIGRTRSLPAAPRRLAKVG